MKTLQLVLLSALMFAALAFPPSGFAQSAPDDDVYYNPGDQPASQPAPTNQNSSDPSNYTPAPQQDDGYDQGATQKSSSESYTDQSGNTYITNNYYDEDDYYDYSYSARLRRFYHPSSLGYYDNYYTNTYWYDYNPYSWGVSIYLSYNWWRPPVHYYYNPTPSWYFGFGYYNYGFYDPWYRPYSGYWSGYNHGYYHGYNQGYWDGYNNGLFSSGYPYYHNSNPYYYNSYDQTSNYYYGQRNSSGSNFKTTANSSLGEKYTKAIETERSTGRPGILKDEPGRSGAIRNIENTNTSAPARPAKEITETRDGKSVNGNVKANPSTTNPRSNETKPALNGQSNVKGESVGKPADRPVKTNPDQYSSPGVKNENAVKNGEGRNPSVAKPGNKGEIRNNDGQREYSIPQKQQDRQNAVPSRQNENIVPQRQPDNNVNPRHNENITPQRQHENNVPQRKPEYNTPQRQPQNHNAPERPQQREYTIPERQHQREYSVPEPKQERRNAEPQRSVNPRHESRPAPEPQRQPAPPKSYTPAPSPAPAPAPAPRNDRGSSRDNRSRGR